MLPATTRSPRSSSTTIRSQPKPQRRSQCWELPAGSKSGGTPAVQVNMLNNVALRRAKTAQSNSEAGVTILEMTIAIMVLTVGLLGLAASIGYAVTVSNMGRNLTNTKLLVVSLLEQMETLRNTEELTFDQIANQGAVDNGGATRVFAGFPTGFQPISINPGPDGIWGTSDDLINPGADNTYGTGGDDFTDPSWGL